MPLACFEGVGITGVGAATSLGLDAANSCAAARAGLLRIAELATLNVAGQGDLWGEEGAAVGHAAPGIPPGMVGAAKLRYLAAAALRDLLQTTPFNVENERTGIMLVLSDRQIEDVVIEHDEEVEAELLGEVSPEDPVIPPPSEMWKIDAQNVLREVLEEVGLQIPPERQQTFFGGHCDAAVAMTRAAELVAKGKLDRCLVGAAASMIEPRTLQAAAYLRLAKTDVNPAGFIPGEAASFFMLEQRASQVQLSAVSVQKFGEENRFRKPPPPATGMGLAKTIGALHASDGQNLPFGLLISDLNGDGRRAMDWGYALLRLQKEVGFPDLPMWLPAASFGEVGTATLGLAICMALRGRARNYAPPGGVLICLSGDSGEDHAAVCLQ